VPSAVWLDSRWSKIKRIGAGLYNLGNNCYLNATLQCMAYTPSLSQWLIGRPHSPVCKIRPVKGFCTLCEVEKIICDIFNSCSEYAKPNSLCFNIKSECQERLELCLVLHVEKWSNERFRNDCFCFYKLRLFDDVCIIFSYLKNRRFWWNESKK
jgi:hypothetical protein